MVFDRVLIASIWDLLPHFYGACTPLPHPAFWWLIIATADCLSIYGRSRIFWPCRWTQSLNQPVKRTYVCIWTCILY